MVGKVGGGGGGWRGGGGGGGGGGRIKFLSFTSGFFKVKLFMTIALRDRCGNFRNERQEIL